jgi:RES domain-containing protein
VEAWRIVKEKHATAAFSGEGAAKTGGRWNSRGVPVVYASANRSLAALEMLVHLNPLVVFRYALIRAEFAEDLVERFSGRLPGDWREEPPPPSTKRIGDDWALKGGSVILAVPSIIIPEETNYLINPAHPHFKKILIRKPVLFAFDRRLIRNPAGRQLAGLGNAPAVRSHA